MLSSAETTTAIIDKIAKQATITSEPDNNKGNNNNAIPAVEKITTARYPIANKRLPPFPFPSALLHKSEGRRDYPSPSPRRSYAMAPTGTVLGRPSCVKRLSRATRTCNSTT